jgi:hypothetical protein
MTSGMSRGNYKTSSKITTILEILKEKVGCINITMEVKIGTEYPVNPTLLYCRILP